MSLIEQARRKDDHTDNNQDGNNSRDNIKIFALLFAEHHIEGIITRHERIST